MPKWESYEEVGTYLLNQFAVKFGLDRVEAKKTFMAIDLEHLGKSMQGVAAINIRSSNSRVHTFISVTLTNHFELILYAFYRLFGFTNTYIPSQ